MYSETTVLYYDAIQQHHTSYFIVMSDHSWYAQKDCQHRRVCVCVSQVDQWLIFISLSSSSLAEKEEKLIGSHSSVRRFTRQAARVLQNSGMAIRRTS